MRTIRFVGCDDPDEYIRRQDEENEAFRKSLEKYTSKWHFCEREGELTSPPNFVLLEQEYGGSWDNYIAAARARREKRTRMCAMARRLETRPIGEILTALSDVRFDGSVDRRDVDALADRVGQEFNVRLSEDFKVYLENWGRATIGNIEMMGIDSSCEYGLVPALRELRDEFGLPDRYYPVAVVYSETWRIIAVCQDADGYVYTLNENDVFEPYCKWIGPFILDVWYNTEKGVL